jgi:hypothetical protein
VRPVIFDSQIGGRPIGLTFLGYFTASAESTYSCRTAPPQLLFFLLLPALTAIMLSATLTVALLAAGVIAHGDHADQMQIAGPHKSLWYNTLPGDGGTQVCQLGGIYPIVDRGG